MAELILFHHLCGLTPGVRSLAAAIAGTEHTVHTPDMFAGNAFETFEQAQTYLATRDPDQISAAVDAYVSRLPGATVFAGISWGAAHAQRVAQTRPAARGALLLESCIPITGEWAFGPWPAGLIAQIHGKDDDEFFAHEGDIDAAREIVAHAETAELFTYPGSEHLFVDSSRASYDAAATTQVIARARQMLAVIDAASRSGL